MMPSYYAIMRAKPGTLLLGGSRHVRSSRFETRVQADDWLTAMQQANTGTCSTYPSRHAPDITTLEDLSEKGR